MTKFGLDLIQKLDSSGAEISVRLPSPSSSLKETDGITKRI